ncbi:4'-phosphopantetheinyl transferase family protein [Niabella insulamsoli]|uniref:4'-phosphopantetheinyl transferase family protein n=1 Tax=Niabella insulamsoli TaxID=3144874 RepID=UPI0031FDD376
MNENLKIKEGLASLSDAVFIYMADIDHIDCNLHSDCITEAEATKAAAFWKADDRKRFLSGRIMIKSILAKWIGGRPSQIKICAGKNGKPVAVSDIAAAWLPHFNISHAGKRVAVAISDHPVGIDLEDIKKVDFAALAPSVFSENERQVFEQSEDPAFIFYKYWTSKEAFLKALGLGLVDDLQTIDISAGIDVSFAGQFTADPLKLDFFRSGSYVGAVCYHAQKQLEFFDFKMPFL